MRLLKQPRHTHGLSIHSSVSIPEDKDNKGIFGGILSSFIDGI